MMKISMQWPPSAALLSEPIRYLLVKTAFMNSSTATAQMLKNFTTEQLEGSGEGILLAHTSNNIQQESMVSPVQTVITNIMYRLLITTTLNYFVPPGHLHQVVCEESTEDHRDSSLPNHGLLTLLP